MWWSGAAQVLNGDGMSSLCFKLIEKCTWVRHVGSVSTKKLTHTFTKRWGGEEEEEEEEEERRTWKMNTNQPVTR